MRGGSRFFTSVGGREVFESGTTKRWRCPDCKWWCDWAVEQCRACGAKRDLAASSAQDPKSNAATAGPPR